MGEILSTGVYAVLSASMLYLAVKDIRERRVPNIAIIALAALWLAWRVGLMFMNADLAASFAMQSAFDLAVAIVIFFGLYGFGNVYERLLKKSSMGMGDVKLIALLALFIGIRGVGICLIIGCLVGLVYAIAHAVRKDPLARGIPFAACLSCGLFVSFLLI